MGHRLELHPVSGGVRFFFLFVRRVCRQGFLDGRGQQCGQGLGPGRGSRRVHLCAPSVMRQRTPRGVHRRGRHPRSPHSGGFSLGRHPVTSGPMRIWAYAHMPGGVAPRRRLPPITVGLKAEERVPPRGISHW